MLAAETPASFVAWDLLALGDEDLRGVPQGERRARLEQVLANVRPPIHLTPATRDRALAADWFDRFEGAGLDGVVAKRLDGAYLPGKRAMLKIKHERTADCVVAGFRWHKNGPGTHVGSLLLGPVRRRGLAPPRRHHELVHVGAARRAGRGARAAARGGARRPSLGRVGGVVGGRDGGRLRAAAPRGDQPLEPGQGPELGAAARERVVEVAYDHLQGDRFRHATTFRRWRPDKSPADCRYDQLETTAPFELARIFGGD